MVSRLRLTRLLLVPAAALALVSGHPWPESSPWDRILPIVGAILLIVAAGGRIWASAYLVGKKNRVLVTEGPFSVVRNPLYLFSFLGFVGAGLVFESVTLAAIFAGVFLVSHWPAVRAEEQRLAALFGEEYERYREEVPRFVPRPTRVRTSGSLVLDMDRFRNALRDCMAIPLVIVVASVVEWAKVEGMLPLLVQIP